VLFVVSKCHPQSVKELFLIRPHQKVESVRINGSQGEYEEEDKEQEAPSLVTGHRNEGSADVILSEHTTAVFIHTFAHVRCRRANHNSSLS
jgi:hypothetical protein